MNANYKKSITSKKSSYRPEIDGFRAFAVVAVIVNHFNKDFLPGGYLGVDIFFVISGFVITSSLYQRPSKHFKDFISGFYERRIKRLIPALSIYVLFMSIAICLFNPKPFTSLNTGLTSLFGLSNLYLLIESTDYFAQTTELNVFTHTWSLGVEEQFYILFPFLIWFSGFGRQTKNGNSNLFLIIGTLTIASLIGFLHLYPSNQPAAYFLMPTRFWEMASGCLLFIGSQKRKSTEHFFGKIPPIFILALIIGIMYLPISLATTSTIAVVLLSCILITSLRERTTAYKIFINPKVVFIGLISYSLYLWHWGVLSISRWTIGIHWWSVPFQLALIFALAITSYKYIENPLRKHNWFGKRWKTLVSGLGLLITISGGLIALSEFLGGRIYLGKKSKCKPYQYETCTSPDHPHKAVTPFIKGTTIQRKECFLYGGPITKEVMELCTVTPSEKKKPSIFIAGSSYSHHFSPVFEALRNEFGIGISMLTTSGCDLDLSLTVENKKGNCKLSNKRRISYIRNNLKEGDILFTGITNSEKFNQSNVKRLADFAIDKNINVIYYSPIPSWQRLSPGRDDLCQNEPEIQWFRSKEVMNCGLSSQIERTSYENEEKNILDFLEKIEKSNPFFHIFYVHKFFCNNLRCPSHINGIRLYRDNTGHISLLGAKQFLSKEIRLFLLNRQLIESSDY